VIQLKLEQEGFHVEVAANGEQALEKLGQQRFDALVTDLRMPKMNGLELAEKVRGELANDELAIIVLTSRTELDLRTWVRGLGNAQFLEKPVTLVESGTWADHLAVSDSSLDQVSYTTLDLSSTVVGFNTAAFGATEPAAVAFIGTTATGTYDGHLALADRSSATVYVVDQSGILQTSFDVSSSAAVQHVAHLPGADKVLVAYDSEARIYDFTGTLLRQYDTAPFGGASVEAVVIHPLTCEHVMADKGLDSVKYLRLGCDADYTPSAEVGSWPYGTGTSFADMHGLTYVPEGFILDGVAAPVGGGFVAVDWNETLFRMYDPNGTVLSETLPTPSDLSNGVTLVEAGTYAGYLAVVENHSALNKLHFVDPTGVASTVSIGIDGISSGPSGLTYIGQSLSGTYNGHLAIVDDQSHAIYIVDQSGTLAHTIDLSAVVNEMQGIEHLRGTDKFLTVDHGDDLARIVDLAGQVTDSYDLSAYDLIRTRAVTVNPQTCDHIIGNKRGATGSDLDEVVYLNGGGGGPPPSPCDGTFRDEFNAQVWSGNDGSLSWTNDWLEVGEGGTATGGDIMVVDDLSPYAARVRDNDNGGEGILRGADLSGYASAELKLDYRRDSLDNASDYVTVDVSSDGGETWFPLDSLAGPDNDTAYQSASYDISAYLSSSTRIRFLGSPDLGNVDQVYFDNVEICVHN
jgi:CheY-like chemotaxis protein